jgi:decaprenylphospho-beta-D-ribofuranose 2-oxidase
MKRETFGWGRYPVAETEWITASTHDDALAAARRLDGVIARGNGRAYGDAAIGRQSTLVLTGLDRMLRFDPESAMLTVEAGVLLSDIIHAFLPRGFFPYVVPGTKLVTVGGAIAADVHGKNHHREGGFGDYVVAMSLASPSGKIVRASREENPDLFHATLGGMGLTGPIVEATIRLRPVETAWIRQTTVVAENLNVALETLAANDDATYSVAWIDCLSRGSSLGRSLVYLGEHARRDELDGKVRNPPPSAFSDTKLSVPIDFPNFVLNRYSVSAFNEAYFRTGARRAGRPFLIAASPYFFPLDGVGDWNRIYGSRGFVQHQCVLPLGKAPSVMAEMLDRNARRGNASFLAVLKKLGRSTGMLSFPLEGYTLTLDLPVSDGLLEFLDELDRLVVKAGGRLYLAKDARQSPETFAAGYPNADAFREMRRTIGVADRVASRLSQRLDL